MSFNSVGLQTPRGSGTSGHVQKNVAVKRTEGVREKRQREAAEDHRRSVRAKMIEARQKAGGDVWNHEQKRLVEVRCMELREKLEDEGIEDSEIEVRVSMFRKSLLPKNEVPCETEETTQESRRSTIKDKEEKFEASKSKDNEELSTQAPDTKNKTSPRSIVLPDSETHTTEDSKSIYGYVPRYNDR